MIKVYDRVLSESEKKILRKHVTETKSEIPKNIRSAAVLTLILVSFVVLVYLFTKTWLIVLFVSASFFIIWLLYNVISDLLKLPKFLNKKRNVIENGVVRVHEISIDRYVKIANLEDEGNYFIAEYKGMLNLIGGQEFLGVRDLKNTIEKIEIMDAQKTEIFYETVKSTGIELHHYYSFEKGIPNTLIKSEIWENLTNRKPFAGRLEELDTFIAKDKQHKNNYE